MDTKRKILDFTIPQYGPVTFQQMVHRLHTDRRLLKTYIVNIGKINSLSSRKADILEERIHTTKEALLEMISSEEFLKLIEDPED